jgi:hypothetical protein
MLYREIIVLSFEIHMIYLSPLCGQNAECLKVKPANAESHIWALYRAKEMALIVCFLQYPLRQTDRPAYRQQRLYFPPDLASLHFWILAYGESPTPENSIQVLPFLESVCFQTVGEAVKVGTATTLQFGRPKIRGLIRGRDKRFFSEKSRLIVRAYPASFSMSTVVKATGTWSWPQVKLSEEFTSPLPHAFMAWNAITLHLCVSVFTVWCSG